MKTIKNLIIIAITILSVQVASAQSALMKDPVSFKLKNGLTIVVAENLGTNKVYAQLTNDAALVTGKAGAQEILNVMLNDTAQKNGLNFDGKGANLAVVLTDFNNTITKLAETVKSPVLNQANFESAMKLVTESLKTNDHYYPEVVTEMGLQDLTLNDIRTFYSSNANPSTAYLTIVGNINTAEVKALVKKSFENWSSVTPEELGSK